MPFQNRPCCSLIAHLGKWWLTKLVWGKRCEEKKKNEPQLFTVQIQVNYTNSPYFGHRRDHVTAASSEKKNCDSIRRPDRNCPYHRKYLDSYSVLWLNVFLGWLAWHCIWCQCSIVYAGNWAPHKPLASKRENVIGKKDRHISGTGLRDSKR